MRFFKGLGLLVTILMLTGCGAAQLLPTQSSQVLTVVRDSVAIHTDTVKVPIPVERYVDVVPAYDTLRLQTSLALSEAWVDTLTHTLKGNLQHKPGALTTDVKYVERVVTVTKDSLVTKEVPVPVEVVKYKTPGWCRRLLVFDLLLLLVFGALAYLKLKGIIKL